MNRSLGILAAALLLGSASAYADPIKISGEGPVYIQFSNAEQFSASNSTGYSAIYGSPNSGSCVGVCGEGNWGILQISSIQQGTALNPPGSDIQGGGTTIFQNQTGGNQILGIFYGVHNTSVSPSGTTSNGGILDLYWWNSNNQNVGTDLNSSTAPAKRTSQDQFTGYTCSTNTANCTFLARFDFVYGANGAGDTNTTIVSPTQVGPTANGTSNSYLSVDLSKIGAWSDPLNSNFFTLDPFNNPLADTPDVRLSTNFNGNGASAWSVAGTDIIGLRSNDPARAFAVPEPASLTIFGTALLLAGAVTWRRRRRA